MKIKNVVNKRKVCVKFRKLKTRSSNNFEMVHNGSRKRFFSGQNQDDHSRKAIENYDGCSVAPVAHLTTLRENLKSTSDSVNVKSTAEISSVERFHGFCFYLDILTNRDANANFLQEFTIPWIIIRHAHHNTQNTIILHEQNGKQP